MTDFKKGKKLAEGKTKIIWEDPDDKSLVLIESKDDITAGDGKRHDIILGKGAWATTTTCNAFQRLNQEGILTHFIGQAGPTMFRARRLRMIPIELVARRVATGSYLQRRPEVTEGTRFDDYVRREFFFKDDRLKDPLMISRGDEWELFDAHRPLTAEVIIGRLTSYCFRRQCGHGITDEVQQALRELLEHAFLCIERAWREQAVWEVDLKVEAGFTDDGLILIGDVVDNDSWRIWPNGDKRQDKSKQVYRDAPVITPEVLQKVAENYAWVARASEKFVT